jgi:hypothetical protein
MKRTIALAALATLAMTAQAQSLPSVEVSAGAAYYKHGEDTFWYQEGLPHSLKMTAPSFGAALVGDVYTGNNWGIGYRAGYTWFGTVRSDATVVSDQNYDEHTKMCTAQCDQTAKFVSSGHAQAITLSLAPYYRTGKWKFAVEAGPAFFRNTWSVNIASTADPSGGFTWTHKPTWEIGYVLGASVGYGEHLSVAYQYFKNQAKADDPVPYIWRSIHLVSLRYTF